MHEQWMAKHGRIYKSSTGKEHRLKIFAENLDFIRSFNNNGTRSYKLAINRFADMTNEEFKAFRTGFSKTSEAPDNSSFRYSNVTDVPPSMDWRSKGAVTPIKNQGGCGSCWAFAAVAAIEGIIQIKENILVSLSEQEILACDQGNNGCAGGFAYEAFKYVLDNGGLSTEDDYPYEKANGTCKTVKGGEGGSNYKAKINGRERVPANNESELVKAVVNQPVVFAIDSTGRNFQFYAGGIFTGGCGTVLDHEVTAVGYGEDEYGTKGAFG
ncbi:Ananain protein [Dioscorea alata]|uniref:Ananain protein n=1 Tax=Dioscorea alata TaxID=55571 RepID=A0ACB7URW1_DIOAL|nr:Ananain protein [Dioscorea alata]